MEIIPCLWIARLKVVKVAVLSKLICRFIAISIRFPIYFDNLVFGEIDKVKKFIWKSKGIRIAKTILRKKSKFENYSFQFQNLL